MKPIPHISQYQLVGSSFVLKKNTTLLRSIITCFISLFFFLPTKGFTTSEPDNSRISVLLPIVVLNQKPSIPTLDVTVEEHAFIAKATSYMQSINVALSDKEARSYAIYIENAASEHDIDKRLLLALIRVESRFKADAVSSSGAKGLAQIVPKYHMAKIVAESSKYTANIFHPGLNVSIGAQVLREYIDSSKNLTNALLKYNGSLGDKTQVYAKLVIAEYDKLKIAML